MKQKRIIIPFGLGIMGLLALAGAVAILNSPARQPAEPAGSVKEEPGVHYNTERVQKATLPAKVTVYRVKPAWNTRDKVMQLAGKLGIKDKKFRSSGDGYYIVEGNDFQMLMVDPGTGTFTFARYDELWWGGVRERKLPEREKAAAIAKKFLRSRGLLPEGAYIDSVDYGKKIKIASGETKNTEVTVKFKNRLDGREVTGVSRLSIVLGDRGEVIGVFNSMPGWLPAGEYPARSLEEVVSGLENGNAVISKMPAGAEEIMLEKVRPAYYLEGRPGWEKILQPVYLLEGKDKKGNPFRAQVQAVPGDCLQDMVKETTPAM